MSESRRLIHEPRSESRRLIHFAYPLHCREDREYQPFRLRDTAAAHVIGDALMDLGYRYTDTIINWPSSGESIIPFDCSCFRETDLILLTTRPPMHDRLIPARRTIRRSWTNLEHGLFIGPLSRWIERSTRPEMALTPAAAAISAEIAKRKSMEFRMHFGAMPRAYGSLTGVWERFETAPPLTVAFLVYAEHAWSGGPGFLAAFGMDPMATLAWCWQLATRFPHLLCTTPFALAEMKIVSPKEPPTWLSFTDAWEVNLLGVAEPTPE